MTDKLKKCPRCGLQVSHWQSFQNCQHSGYAVVQQKFDLISFINEQIKFSEQTFGPGQRLDGVLKHIKKELIEVEECQGKDAIEWADVIILAIDGAWRSGHSPLEITNALEAKLDKNKARKWPDWRTAGPGAIEHLKDKEAL